MFCIATNWILKAKSFWLRATMNYIFNNVYEKLMQIVHCQCGNGNDGDANGKRVCHTNTHCSAQLTGKIIDKR